MAGATSVGHLPQTALHRAGTRLLYRNMVRPRCLLLVLALTTLTAACERGPVLDPALAEAPLPALTAPIDQKLADAGAWYFRRNCSACHHVGGSDALIGPNLAGVTERREMAWIAAMIRRPDSMIMHDSTARALLEQYKVPMANRELDGARIRAVIEFLRRADSGPAAEPQENGP